MSTYDTQPEVIRVTGTRPRERERERARERERERDYYEEETFVRRRPGFLRDDYDRSDRAPLVVREREVVRRRSSLDDRRPRSPSPNSVVIRKRTIERSLSPPPVERVRTRVVERRFSQDRDGKHSPSPSPPPAPPAADEVIKLTTIERHTTRYQEVDEVIWDLSRTKDVTLHLELDVAQDLELDLDEFCRLGRLGNFHQAKQFFQDNLEKDMDDPYVFVQHAQMLLEMGDYKNIKALNVPYCLERPENLLLRTNWKLIQSISTLRTEGLGGKNDMFSTQEAAMAAASAIPRALEGANHELPKQKQNQKDKWTEIEKRFVSKEAIEELRYEYEETESYFYIMEVLDDKAVEELRELSEKYKPAESGLNKSSVFGSTECQILSLSLCFLTHFPGTEIKVFPWRAIYETILRQGRIWDLRDILTAAVRLYGQEIACAELLGSDEGPTNKIIADWSAAIYDESTNLALLDTLVSLVLARPFSQGIAVGIRDFVDQAGYIASSIMQHQPSLLKSRQYIRWILAKVAITNYRDVISSGPLSELPGLFLTNRAALDSHIYVPVASETPDWSLLCLPSKSNETQQMVLKAARELHDLTTEAECLKQLIAHSQDPTEYYNELIRLQKTVQNDLEGWLHTCLSKYITCRDKPSRDSLREEILSVSNYTKLDAELLFARCMILRALAQSEQEANLLLVQARERSQVLSPTIHSFMERNQLMAEDVSQVEPQLAYKTSILRKSQDEDLRKGNSKAVAFSGMSPRERDKERVEIGTRGEDDGTAYLLKRHEERAYIGEAYNGATKDWNIVDVPPGTERVRMGGVQDDTAEVTWQKYNGVRKSYSRSKSVSQRESPALQPNAGIDETRDGPAARYRDEHLEYADQQKDESSSSLRRSEKDSKMETLNPEESAPPDFDESDDSTNIIVRRMDPGEDFPSPPHTPGGSYYPNTNKFPPPPGRSNPVRESPQPPTENLAQHPSKMQITRYNPGEYLRLAYSNNGPKQTLSDIYVTIDEAATEAKGVSRRVGREEEKMEAAIRYQNDVTEPGGNEVEDPTDDEDGWRFPKKSNKKKQSIYTRTEPMDLKADDLTDTEVIEETEEPVEEWAVPGKSKKDKKKRQPGPWSQAEPVEDASEQERAPETSRSRRPPPVTVDSSQDDSPPATKVDFFKFGVESRCRARTRLLSTLLVMEDGGLIVAVR